MQETQENPLDQEDPLEKEMATHSSILSWEIPWTGKPVRLQSMGLDTTEQLSNKVYACQCHSLNLSPLLLPHCVHISNLCTFVSLFLP